MVNYLRWGLLGGAVGIVIELLTSIPQLSIIGFSGVPVTMIGLIIAFIAMGLSAIVGRFIYGLIPLGKGLYSKLFVIFLYAALASLLIINLLLRNLGIDIQMINILTSVGIISSIIGAAAEAGIAYGLDKYNIIKVPD